MSDLAPIKIHLWSNEYREAVYLLITALRQVKYNIYLIFCKTIITNQMWNMKYLRYFRLKFRSRNIANNLTLDVLFLLYFMWNSYHSYA